MPVPGIRVWAASRFYVLGCPLLAPLVDVLLGPDEWLGCLVVCCDEGIDVRL